MQEPSSSLTRTFLVPTLLGFVIAAGIAFPSCKKDEPPPPLPSASAAAVETPAPVLTLAQEDAGDVGDAATDAKKLGKGVPATSFKKCCVALRQNAKSAPPPTNMYMEAAAAACDGAVAAGQDKTGVVATVRAMLKGAAMPADCY
jgi:hypothetical protein